MARAEYLGVGGVSRKIKSKWIGVNNVARSIKKEYIGVNNVARMIYSSKKDLYTGMVGLLQEIFSFTTQFSASGNYIVFKEPATIYGKDILELDAGDVISIKATMSSQITYPPGVPGSVSIIMGVNGGNSLTMSTTSANGGPFTAGNFGGKTFTLTASKSGLFYLRHYASNGYSGFGTQRIRIERITINGIDVYQPYND